MRMAEVLACLQALKGQHTHLGPVRTPRVAPVPPSPPPVARLLNLVHVLGWDTAPFASEEAYSSLGLGLAWHQRRGQGPLFLPMTMAACGSQFWPSPRGPNPSSKPSSCQHLPPASAGHTGWASGRSSAGPFLTPASVSLPLTGGKGRTAKRGLHGQERL